MDVRVGLWRKLSTEELMLLNCGVEEDSWELGLQGDPTSPSKGNQSWVFIGRTDAEAETSILRPLNAKNWLIWKDPDAGEDSRWEEKGTTEDEMVGWHHWLDGREFEWTPGVGDGQGGLARRGPWGCRGSDMTERLDWLTGWGAASLLPGWGVLDCFLTPKSLAFPCKMGMEITVSERKREWNEIVCVKESSKGQAQGRP